MKCPSCENVISDLRDICPQCTTDLRSYKKAIGKPIRNPSVGYEELFSKEMNRPLPPSLGARGGARGFLGSLFQRTPRPSSKETTVSSGEAPPSIVAQGVFAKETPGEVPSSKPEVSFTWGIPDLSESSRSRQEEGAKSPTVMKSPPPVIELKNVISEDVASGSEGPVEIAFDESDFGVSVPQDPSAPPLTPIEHEQVTVSEPGDASATMIEAPPPQPSFKRSESTDPFSKIDTPIEKLTELFNAARQEIRETDSLSVSVEQIQKLDAGQTREKIELFFALAQEAIDNPEFERTLAIKIAEAESRHVSSEELLAQLIVTEKAVSTPLLSLKKTESSPDDASSATPNSPQEWRRPVLLPAAGGVRFFGAAVDLLVLVLLSLGLSALFFGELPEGVISPRAPEMIPLYATGLICFVVASFMYQLLSLLIFGTTAGSVATGSQVVNNDGGAIPFRKLLVRSLSVPLSILIGGGVPALFGRRALHDVLSRSMVIDSTDLVS